MMNATNNNVTINVANLSASERATLEALMAKANAPQDTRFKPAMNAEYHDIDSKGAVHRCTWREDAQDIGAFAIGNVFPTTAAAKFFRDGMKIKNQMRAFASDKSGGRDAMYYIYGDNGQVKIGSDATYTNDLRFETQAHAQKAIDTVGAENVKKYYLGM